MWCILPESKHSTSSPEPVAESLPTSCSDISPLAQSKSKHIPERFCFNGSLTDAYLNSLFGTMCEHSDLTTQTQAPTSTGFAESEANSPSVADSPARTSAPQERVQVSPESEVVFGMKWPALSARYDRDTSSWKTLQCLFPEDSMSCSVKLPRWGMMQNGELSALTMPEEITNATGYGFGVSWPTPCASESVDNGTNWASLAAVDKGGRIARRMATLGMQETQETSHAALNPTWVEWLMAWPLGWTDLRPLETDRFRAWLKSHGAS